MRFNNIKLHASDTRVEEKMRKKIMEEMSKEKHCNYIKKK